MSSAISNLSQSISSDVEGFSLVRHLSDFEKDIHGAAYQFFFESRMMNLNNFLHRNRVGEFYVVEEASPQKRIRSSFSLLLVIMMIGRVVALITSLVS